MSSIFTEKNRAVKLGIISRVAMTLVKIVTATVPTTLNTTGGGTRNFLELYTLSRYAPLKCGKLFNDAKTSQLDCVARQLKVLGVLN